MPGSCDHVNWWNTLSRLVVLSSLKQKKTLCYPCLVNLIVIGSGQRGVFRWLLGPSIAVLTIIFLCLLAIDIRSSSVRSLTRSPLRKLFRSQLRCVIAPVTATVGNYIVVLIHIDWVFRRNVCLSCRLRICRSAVGVHPFRLLVIVVLFWLPILLHQSRLQVRYITLRHFPLHSG
jgi:hypothetical protein